MAERNCRKEKKNEIHTNSKNKFTGGYTKMNNEEIKASLMRCQYCGSKLKPDMFGAPPLYNYCNKECEKKITLLWKKREKRGVCVSCGSLDIAESEKRPDKKLCKECLFRIQNLFEDIELLHKQIENDERERKGI